MYARVNPGRHKGLTLTEVLVALMILAAAMVPILKALTQAHRGSAVIEQRSTSWLLAQSQLEVLRARAFADWNSAWTQGDVPLGEGYYGRVTDSGPAGDLRTVRVEAGYDADSSGTLEPIEVAADLTTLIARRD